MDRIAGAFCLMLLFATPAPDPITRYLFIRDAIHRRRHVAAIGQRTPGVCGRFSLRLESDWLCRILSAREVLCGARQNASAYSGPMGRVNFLVLFRRKVCQWHFSIGHTRCGPRGNRRHDRFGGHRRAARRSSLCRALQRYVIDEAQMAVSSGRLWHLVCTAAKSGSLRPANEPVFCLSLLGG